MTFTEIRHDAAGHPGSITDCPKCQATDPARPVVNRRARRAAVRRTAAVTRRLDQHR